LAFFSQQGYTDAMKRLAATLLACLVPGSLQADRRHAVCVPTVVPAAVVATSFIEVPVAVAAVSFAYLSPIAVSSAPSHGSFQMPMTSTHHATGQFLARPYEEFYGIARTQGTAVASLLQQRCGSCHQQQTKGGVRLLDHAGQLVLTKNGQAIDRLMIAAIVRQGRMPPSGPLPEAEKNVLTNWIFDPS
jgi:mono/diheme cytochrome c family protein